MNELVRRTATYVAKNDDSLGKEIGKAAVVIGGGGLALAGIAALLPFVNLLMLLTVVAMGGAVLWFR